MWVLIAVIFIESGGASVTSLTSEFFSEGRCLDALERLQQAIHDPVIGICTRQ